MAFRFNSIALLLSSSLTGVGAWLGYELNKPKTVKDLIVWKGLTLASEEDSGIWEALYFQGKSELGDKAKDAITLKQFCVKTSKEKIDYSSKNFEYVEKFCINAFRRVRIIAKGFKETDFLENDDDYRLAFIFNRYSPTFLSLLGRNDLTQDSEIADNPELLQAYKDYCSEVLNADDTKIEVAKQLCSKRTEKTATEWLRKEGYELKNDAELKSEFKDYEQKGDLKNQKYVVGSTFLEAIKEKGSQKGEDSWIELTKNQDKFFVQFKKYCDAHKDKSLFEKDFLKKTYPEFKARCAKEIKKLS